MNAYTQTRWAFDDASTPDKDSAWTQGKVAEMDGRAGAKKSETVRKRSVEAVDDQKWLRIALPKKRSFLYLETNRRADGNQIEAFFNHCVWRV